MKDIAPNAFGSPPYKAVVKRLARPVEFRRVDPSASGFQNMNDPAYDPAVIDTRFATRIGGKKWFKTRKLSLRQPKIIVIHQQSPFQDCESQFN